MTGREQRGAATLLVVAMAGIVLLAGCAVAAGAGLVVAHRRAQAAADLAALAGAAALQEGQAPCAVAGTLAARNGARLAACRVHDSDVVVRTVVPGPRAAPWPVQLAGDARAGPDG